MGKHEFTKEELSNLLISLYNKNKSPITSTMLEIDNTIPTKKVFTRLFGSWQKACEFANIPYEKKKIDAKVGNYHRLTNRIGEEKLDRNGCVVRIIEYNNANDIVIEFQDEHKFKIKTTYKNWTNNDYNNPYNKSIFNIGYIGNTCSKINGIKKESYKVWYAMMQRCYKECFNNKPTYKQCFVCDEWCCYENFEKWYDGNFYNVDNEQMMLDKDILLKGNTLYCPELCVFVPQSINKLFTKRQLHRGKYLIGVCYDSRSNKYTAHCSNGTGNSVYLGSFDNEYDAFLAYKQFKEHHIKEVANYYKNKIPEKLYQAMYDYKVENTD